MIDQESEEILRLRKPLKTLGYCQISQVTRGANCPTIELGGFGVTEWDVRQYPSF